MEIEVYDKIKDHDISKYISLPIMTKYEFNLLIGLRTVHLSRGAQIFVEIPENYKIRTNMELREIAIRELKEKKLPYTIKRKMPNGKIEYWPVSKLNLNVVRHMMNH